MAYNAYNGFADDVMDGVETSGPKVTVREVSLANSSAQPHIDLSVRRSNRIDATLSYNHALFPSQIPYVAPCMPKSLPSPSI